MSDAFTQAEYLIDDYGKKSRTIAGWVHRDGWLATHAYGDYWVVDHLPSGLEVTKRNTLADAQSLICKLAALDWNFRSINSPKIKRMKPAVLAILNK